MLVSLPNNPVDSEVDRLAAEFLAAAERGQAPDPADWLARHPTHAAELAAFLADLGLFAPLLGLPAPPGLDLTADFREASASEVEPVPGERFDVYELIEKIGQGGMGTVYRAAMSGTKVVVALKLLKPGVGGNEPHRFRDEVRAAAGLRHPNVVPLYHVGECDGRPYFTMRLAEGGSLDRCAARYVKDTRAVVQLMLKVARGVHHAHQRQIVHRDLKPANILLDDAGEPMVADFGLAAQLDEIGSTDVGPAGSLPWMAPETVRGEPVTTSVDVWAIGAILYELLTGQRPFPQRTRGELRAAILEQAPPPPRSLSPRIDADLDAVCLRCLKKAPGDRYESASAVALELERWLRDEPVRARPASRRERLARWYRHNPALAWGGLLLAALLGGGGVLGVVLAEEQAAALRAQVCERNEDTAWHVANSVLLKLQQMSEPVSRAAADQNLHRICTQGKQEDIESRLKELFSTAPTVFETVYVLDSSGRIIALIEPGSGAAQPKASVAVGRLKPDRDYFIGAQRHWKTNAVHVSRVFHSDHDGKDKIAISCPLHRGDCSPGPWVLAATITTDDTLGLIHLQGQNQKKTLVVPRDPSSLVEGEPDRDGYRILVHEVFKGRKGAPCIPFPTGKPSVVSTPNGGPELEMREEPDPPPFAQDENYRDPVADTGDPRYAGRWLVGSARVGNTEMVVIIQQSEEVVVAPQWRFFRRLMLWSCGALGAAGLVLVSVRGARERRPRPEALPENGQTRGQL